MDVSAQARLWWSPQLTVRDSLGSVVVVPSNAWEASFDSGATWRPSRDNSGVAGWLVAGKDFPGPGDSTGGIASDVVVAERVQPLVRLRDTPETVVGVGEWLIPT